MSSPEELTLVVGRWLRPVVAVLHVVRPGHTNGPGTRADARVSR